MRSIPLETSISWQIFYGQGPRYLALRWPLAAYDDTFLLMHVWNKQVGRGTTQLFSQSNVPYESNLHGKCARSKSNFSSEIENQSGTPFTGSK